MSLAWGNSAGDVGDSALDLDVTNLNLADWRPFLGNTVSAGDVNLQLKLSSQQGGKQLGFDLNSQISDLAARIGSNQTFQATVNLQAQGEAADFKQFKPERLPAADHPAKPAAAHRVGFRHLQSGRRECGRAGRAGGFAGRDWATAFPQPDTKISSGTLKLNGRVTQKQNTQTVTGQLTLADLTGQLGKNSFA